MGDAVSIILVALAAFLLPLLARRVRLPGIVLEILFGIAIGPALLGWIHESIVMEYLAELGLLLLMFLSGFEIDFARLRRQGSGQAFTGLAVFALTVATAFWSARYLGHGPFVGLLLATTSVGLVIPTLRSARRASTPLGQAIIISALTADLLTLIAVTFFAMIRERGVGWHLLNIPVLFLGIAFVLFVLKRLSWWYPERFERLFDPHDPDEMGIRTCLAMMFVFVGLSYLLGVEAILGAFMAGTVFAFVFRNRGELERKMKGFSYGFLIPIFFINVGIHFDVEALFRPGVFVGALSLIAAAAVIKIVASSILIFRRLSLREVLAAGVLLSARLSLVIAVANLGARLGILDRALESQVILLALITSTLCPTLFLLLQPPLGQAAGPQHRQQEQRSRARLRAA